MAKRKRKNRQTIIYKTLHRCSGRVVSSFENTIIPLYFSYSMPKRQYETLNMFL